MYRVFLPLLTFVAVSIGITSGVPEARAATVVAMNLEQMTDRADTIFIGRVVGERADWSADRSLIYTNVSFQVDRFLKGDTGAGTTTVTVRLIGGRVGHYLMRLPGSPSFEPGEEVLLFCAGSVGSLPTVLGLSLGKFTIRREGDGDGDGNGDGDGEAIVKRDISSLVLASYRTDSREPGELVHRYRLDEIETRIREQLR